MPFHIFGPPHLHMLPIVLTSGLAFAAGAYVVAKNGVLAGVGRLGKTLKDCVQARGRSFRDGSYAAMMASRGSSARNSTGNTAFNDYRDATLKDLEGEADQFRSYLDGLRHARDKSEFDAFLDERRATKTTETLAP